MRWRRLVADPGDRYFFVIAVIKVFVPFPGVLNAVRFLSMDFTVVLSIASSDLGSLVVVLLFHFLGCDFLPVASERLGAFKLIANQLVFGFSAPAAFHASAPVEVIMSLYSVRGSCRGRGPCQDLPEILGALDSSVLVQASVPSLQS